MRAISLALGVLAVLAACEHKSSSNSGSTSPSSSPAPTGGGTPASVQTGSVALVVQNVGGGAALAENPTLALDTVGEIISFTPTKYVLPLASIAISNSKGTNTLATATETGTGTGTATTTGTETATTALDGTGGSGSSSDPNHSVVYSCPGTTEAKCNIDLADNAAMKAAFGAPVALPVGTYDTISYAVLCTTGLGSNGGGGFHIGIEGTFAIDGTTYYTTSGSEVLSTSASDLGVANTTITACGGNATSFTLPTPVQVTEGSTVTISVFLSSTNISWASTEVGSPGLGGCVNGTSSNYVCTSLPSVVPAAGTFQPTVELYTISVDGYGDGQVGIMVDNQSNAIGAYYTRLYTTTALSATIWDAGITVFSKNSDGTYDIGSSTDPGAAGPRCEFPNFQRATHTGTLKTSGTPHGYTATKQ